MKHTEKVNRPADADRLIDNFHLERDENHLWKKAIEKIFDLWYNSFRSRDVSGERAP